MMTALPDLADEFEALERRAELREPVETATGRGGFWKTGLILCAGLGLLLSAAGIWAFPSADNAERLIRLGASLGLFGAGAAVLSVLGAGGERARAEIDPERREIRTYETDSRGCVFLTGRYGFSQMSDISLRDGTFQARDGEGRVVVSVPVRGRARVQAIHRALSLV